MPAYTTCPRERNTRELVTVRQPSSKWHRASSSSKSKAFLLLRGRTRGAGQQGAREVQGQKPSRCEGNQDQKEVVTR